MRFDFNCFSGNWPFHKIRCNTVEKLIATHQHAGIEGGLVSSLEAVFYQDPFEADLELSRQLQGKEGYFHCQTIDPMHSGWESILRHGVEDLHVSAVRIYPGFHGYTLDHPAVGHLCRLLQEYKLPLVITVRMEDERFAYLFQPKIVPAADISGFLQQETDLPVLLTNIRPEEYAVLVAQLQERNDVFCDFSGYRGGADAIRRIEAQGIVKNMVYGSLTPLCTTMSTVFALEHDDASRETRETIFAGEALYRLLEKG